MSRMELWTDGSAGPTNPGPGGWAVVSARGVVKLGSEQHTTSVRMEGTAIIEAIRHAAGGPVTVYSDSQLWIRTLTEWAPGWERNNWRKSDGSVPMNLDLVQTALFVYRIAQAQTQLRWVKGHNGNKGNERADAWATKARIGQLKGLHHAGVIGDRDD